jgi:hypothetical protein
MATAPRHGSGHRADIVQTGRSTLANLLLNVMGGFAEFVRTVLQVRERVLGGEHPDTLSTRHSLTFALGDPGRFEPGANTEE